METVDTLRIGRRMRALRRGQLMTQAELAERAGMHVDQVSRVERDTVEPRFSTVKKIAAALGVDPRELAQ
jgi:XRE family transcriptional regulator, fatty acid utilization regulator